MSKTAPMMRLCAGTRRRRRDEPAPSVDLGRGPIPLGGTIATASSSTTEPNLAFARQMTPSSPRVRVENAPNGGTVQVCWLCALFRGLDGIRSLGLRALGRRFHPCPSLGSVRKDLPLLYPRIATRATAILPRFSRRRRLRQPPRCIWDRSRSACRGDRALIANAGLASRSGRCRSNVQNNDAGDDDLDWSSRASEPVRSAQREVTDVGIEPIHRLEATMCPFPKFRPS